MDAFAKGVTDPFPPAEQTDRNRIPLRLIGYRIPHTDERCPRRSPGGVYCRSMRGHEGVHMAPDPYEQDSIIWWF